MLFPLNPPVLPLSRERPDDGAADEADQHSHYRPPGSLSRRADEVLSDYPGRRGSPTSTTWRSRRRTPRPAKREAIREATESARARAQVIAEAGGGRLGRTLRLSTEGSGEAVRHFDSLGLVTTMSAEQAPLTGATVVVAPVLTVSATVHGRWEFTEAPR